MMKTSTITRTRTTTVNAAAAASSSCVVSKQQRKLIPFVVVVVSVLTIIVIISISSILSSSSFLLFPTNDDDNTFKTIFQRQRQILSSSSFAISSNVNYDSVVGSSMKTKATRILQNVDDDDNNNDDDDDKTAATTTSKQQNDRNNDDDDDDDDTNRKKKKKKNKHTNYSIAERIIYDAYNKSYALIDKVCFQSNILNKKNSTNPLIDDDTFMNKCFTLLYKLYIILSEEEEQEQENNSTISTNRKKNRNKSTMLIEEAKKKLISLNLLTKQDIKNMPWWFVTLIRDGPQNGSLNASWRKLFFYFNNNHNNNNSKTKTATKTKKTRIIPHLCTIEKVGTKQWRKLQCLINENKTNIINPLPCQNIRKDYILQKILKKQQQQQQVQGQQEITTKRTTTISNNQQQNVEEHEHENIKISQFIFLRDPLDRFLSGYMDKCEKYRKNDIHCEPLNVFMDDTNELTNGLLATTTTATTATDTNTTTTTTTKNNNNNKKSLLLFETYVNTFPLKWNMHFFPQSLYCNGLAAYQYNNRNNNNYYYNNNYDFIGYMDNNFYNHIDKLGKFYDDEKSFDNNNDNDTTSSSSFFQNKLNDIFHYKDKINIESTSTNDSNNNNNNNNNNNYGVERQTSTHVLEYYTPKTLRKVLQYISIDYVMFKSNNKRNNAEEKDNGGGGLNIPDWVEDMLQKEYG